MKPPIPWESVVEQTKKRGGIHCICYGSPVNSPPLEWNPYGMDHPWHGSPLVGFPPGRVTPLWGARNCFDVEVRVDAKVEVEEEWKGITYNSVIIQRSEETIHILHGEPPQRGGHSLNITQPCPWLHWLSMGSVEKFFFGMVPPSPWHGSSPGGSARTR